MPSIGFISLFSPLLIAIITMAKPNNPKVSSFYHLPSLDLHSYNQLGDINIGDIIDLYTWVPNEQECREKVMIASDVPESTEPVKFAVDLVNSIPDLLPNVTLGFIISPGCRTISAKLAASLSFLPRIEKVCSNMSCYTQPKTPSLWDSQYLTHDVIGMLAPVVSSEATAMSYLFTMARLPVIGYMAGGYELDNKKLHPYFFKVNSQDLYQIKAILKFISWKGWTYIQMVYRNIEVGRDAYKLMHQHTGDYGICIAGSHVLGNYDQVAHDIVQNPRARAIVVFISTWRFRNLLKSIDKQNMTHHFIWIGNDKLQTYPGYRFEGIKRDPGHGAFFVHPSIKIPYDYYEYIRHLDIRKTKNPWLKKVWEGFQYCSYNAGTCRYGVNILGRAKYIPYYYVPLKIEAVLAFAVAAHNLIKERCPGASGKNARRCITGELLREYLKKVNFESINGLVRFNKNQSIVGNFMVFQLGFGEGKDYFGYVSKTRMLITPIAMYDSSTDRISDMGENIKWSHLDIVKRLMPRDNSSMNYDVPESVCSRPCVVGEYKLMKNLPCCWDCQRCRENERLVEGEGNDRCEACPLLQWPDPESEFMNCLDIVPTFQRIYDTIPTVFVFVAVCAISLTIFVFSAYVKYRNERVIKASSKEVSIIQLAGIGIGYSTVILFLTKPTDITCRVIFFLFCMSFASLYCPLLVKTVRIVRIFQSAKKNTHPRFISPQSQISVSVGLITVQFLLCSGVYFLYLPGARRTHPIWSEKMVELSCDFTLPGLASFLCYNIFLVSLCSVFAFMVRKLPDNYNESRYISMCVSTTLLIWMAFVPTYFTADREYIRMFLLCMALILNHSVALAMLFIPKLYAARFQDSGALNFAMKK